VVVREWSSATLISDAAVEFFDPQGWLMSGGIVALADDLTGALGLEPISRRRTGVQLSRCGGAFETCVIGVERKCSSPEHG
jgi:hypothetical protein